jgi:putative ABC transport system substrate-binding protein
VWLSPGSRAGNAFLQPFLDGMALLGHLPGKNFELDERWGDNSLGRLEQLALEAAGLNPALYVCQGPALHVARKLPGTAPIVFGNSGDPLEAGIAQSLARPGGRFTGITFLSYALVGKRVELLREVAPKARRLGRADALVVHPDALMVQRRVAIGQFTVERRIPAISGWATMAEGGCLLTYGPNLQVSYRRLAYFVDRILKGARPADIPIELPSTVELVINLKSAKALGLTVPPSLLLRADRVIV